MGMGGASSLLGDGEEGAHPAAEGACGTGGWRRAGLSRVLSEGCVQGVHN